jgi:hypothetical protein
LRFEQSSVRFSGLLLAMNSLARWIAARSYSQTADVYSMNLHVHRGHSRCNEAALHAPRAGSPWEIVHDCESSLVFIAGEINVPDDLDRIGVQVVESLFDSDMD